MEKYTPDTVEVNTNAAGSISLFDVRLQVGVGDDGQPQVSVVPGLQDIKHALVRIVDDMVAAVKVIQPSKSE